VTVRVARLTGATLAALTLGYLCVRSLGSSSTFRWVIPWSELAGMPSGITAVRHGRRRPCSVEPSAVPRTSLDTVRLRDGVGDDATARALHSGEEKLSPEHRSSSLPYFRIADAWAS